MADGNHASEARIRLRAAEERAARADQRAADALRELAHAPDATARAALEYEMGVHRRAAETHRRAVAFQRVHLEHEERARR